MTPVHLELKNALNSLDAHWELTNAAAKVSELASYIRHFEAARETGSRRLSLSALLDCFGGQICRPSSPTMHLTTISTRSPAQPQSGE